MDTTLKPMTIHRTVLRIAVGAMFFIAGLSFASWASRIATVQHKLGLSYSVLGLVLLSLPTGLMISLPFSGWIISKVGSKRVLLTAIIGYGLALIGLGLSQNIVQLAICLAFFGFAGNTVNISVNTQAVAAEKMYARPIMASFHGIWSGAGFIGGLFGAFVIGKQVDPFHHFIIILAIIFLSAAIVSRYLYDDHLEAKNASPNKLSFRERIKLMIPLLPLGSIAFCSMICEGAMFDWSVIYFKNVLLAPSAIVGYGFAAFMFTMASGRFVADFFSHRFGLKRTLEISGTLTATGLLIAVIFPYLYTAMAGFMLVGAGVSSVVPMVYSAAGKSTTMSAGVALAAVSTIGFFGFLVGPPLIGFIAGIATLRASFIFIACMGASVVFLSSRAKL